LNREVFDTLREAKVLVERWRREYNHTRLHSSLGYILPAPEAVLPVMRTHHCCCSVPLHYILHNGDTESGAMTNVRNGVLDRDRSQGGDAVSQMKTVGNGAV